MIVNWLRVPAVTTGRCRGNFAQIVGSLRFDGFSLSGVPVPTSLPIELSPRRPMRIPSALISVALISAPTVLAAAQVSAPFTRGLTIAPETTRIESLHDIDGDGIKDAVGWMIVDSNVQQIRCSVHLFDGQGRVRRTVQTLSPNFGSHYNLGHATGSAVGDFDGDGQPEQVVLIYDTLLRMEFDALGDITFLPSSLHPSPYVAGFSSSKRQMRVLDFDGDGQDDFVMVGWYGIELWTLALGSFQRVGKLNWTTPVGSTIDLGEFDGQPGTDLVVSYRNAAVDHVGIYSFAGGVIHLHDNVQLVSPGSGTDICTGDIDNDGDDDLLNFGYHIDPTPGVGWVPTLETLHQTAPGVFTAAPLQLRVGPATELADIDGDGDLDGICCGGGGSHGYVNNTPSTFEIAINDGNGVFRLAEQFQGLGAEHIGGPVDFDGDGDIDLVAGRVVLLNTTRVGALECVGSDNSTGLPAVLQLLGSSSLGRNDLVLHTRNLPAGQFGLSLFGTEAQQVPLFDGELCVGGQIVRLPIQTADAAGRMEVPLDFTSALASGLAPGNVIHVQTWFRDPSGTTGANLSASGRVLLMP